MGATMIYNPITGQMEQATAIVSHALASYDEIAAGIVDDKIVTPKGLAGALVSKAPLASPTFTGDVVVPDQTAGNNSTKAANTKYADAKVADAINDGVTGIAPSQNAVFDALALKADAGDVTASLALKADITLLNTEKQLLIQEIDSLKKTSIENSNAPYLTVSDYGDVALAKNSVGVGTVGVDGVTVENLVNGKDVVNTGTVTFTSILNNVYWDSLHKAKLTGTGSDMIITNDTGAVADVMVINLTAHGLASLTEAQLADLLPIYFEGEKTFGGVGCIRATGKNIFNKNTGWVQGRYLNTLGVSVSSSSYSHTNFIKCNPNTVYKQKYRPGSPGNVCFFNAKQEFLSSATGGDVSGFSFTTPDKCAFLKTTILNSTGGTINNFQIGLGAINTGYSKYTESRQFFSTIPMYSNATAKDTLTYSGGKYYHTHNVDSDGVALVTPYNTEVQTNGQFDALAYGEVTYEPWYPDIGIYTDKFTLTKAITAVKELYKYGSETPITDAVIAGDGLSFTSASLTAGDLAYGVFEFSEPLRPLLTIKSRNDDATIVDTANGKVYTFRPVITNGAIASWAVTEV